MAVLTVRIVIFAESPFEPQWDDQVIPPRKNDWREFVAEKLQERKLIG